MWWFIAACWLAAVAVIIAWLEVSAWASRRSAPDRRPASPDEFTPWRIRKLQERERRELPRSYRPQGPTRPRGAA